MLDDVFYLYCRFKGNDASRYYTDNKNYLMEVRVGRFNKRVKIRHVSPNGRTPFEGSERRYDNKESFEKTWKVIRDLTQEV